MENENILSGYGDDTLLDGQSGAAARVLDEEAATKGAAWKKVAMGTGFGIVFGSAATLATDTAIREKEAETKAAAAAAEPEAETETNSLPYVDNEVRVATSVSDEMSFSQAFAAARGEVGSGGAFEWRGNLYNTFTVEEWDSMSLQEHAEYGSHFDWAAYNSAHPHHAAQPTAQPQPAPLSGGAGVAETGNGDIAVIDTHEPEIEVLGVVHHQDPDVNIGGVLVDGQEFMLVDVDNDGTFDCIVSDLNHDGKLQEEEIADISDGNITVEGLGGFTDTNEELYASNGDADIIDNGVLM